MKRKTTIALMLLFFFPLVYTAYANNISNSPFLAPPSNDDCSNAIDLTVNDNYLCTNKTSGTLAEATASSITPGCGVSAAQANDDVWFKFTATSTQHRVELSNVAGSPTDLYMIFYDAGVSGSCGSMTVKACSDPDTANLTSLTVGNVYYVRVFSYATDPGATTTFDICVGTEPTVPVNDDCSSAIAISSFPFSSSYDATAATGGFVTSTGCITLNDGVWFTLVGDGNKIDVKVTPTGWNAAIGVYTGSCSSFTCVEDSNIGGTGLIEMASFNSVNGTTYYINVAFPSGTVDGAEGQFALDVTSTILSIDEIIAKGFSYYPNPVNGVLKMSASEPIKQISLYSILGKEIKRIEQSDLNAELDFSNLPAGAYYVRATVGDKSGSFKIIKN